MRIFGEISKFQKLEDGKLVVTGIASTPSVDADGEVIDPIAIKAAIPEYMKFGAVREMHGNNAAGTALSIEVDEAGATHFTAKVVDPNAIIKVEEGVYKGFSIGGKATKRDGKRIIGLNLTEVSLVDRPANPDCVFDVWKAAGVEGKPTKEPTKMTVITKALGLPETATEAEVADALTKRLNAANPEVDQLKQQIDELKKSITTMDVAKLGTTVADLEKRAKEADAIAQKTERAAVVAEASRDGKVIPLSNEEIDQMPVAILKSMVSKLTKTVKLTAAPEIAAGKPADPKELSEIRKAAKARSEQSLTELFANSGIKK